MANQCCGTGSLNTDPDPAFQVNPDPIRIQGFDDQKLKNTIQLKFLYIFLIQNCNLLIPRHPALEREHPALQDMKFINFFLFLWVFCPPGSGYETLWLSSNSQLEKTDATDDFCLFPYVSLWLCTHDFDLYRKAFDILTDDHKQDTHLSSLRRWPGRRSHAYDPGQRSRRASRPHHPPDNRVGFRSQTVLRIRNLTADTFLQSLIFFSYLKYI